MATEKPLKTLDERVGDLEQQLEVALGQLQSTQRATFLIVAKYLGGALPIPDKNLADKLVDLTVPCGFAVRCMDGHNVKDPFIITNHGHNGVRK